MWTKCGIPFKTKRKLTKHGWFNILEKVHNVHKLNSYLEISHKTQMSCIFTVTVCRISLHDYILLLLHFALYLWHIQLEITRRHCDWCADMCTRRFWVIKVTCTAMIYHQKYHHTDRPNDLININGKMKNSELKLYKLPIIYCIQ